MVIYESTYEYLQSCKSIKDKITALDAVIAALYITAEKSAANDNIKEYSLDDGQTKIKTMYKGTDAVLTSIKGFEGLRDAYVVRYNKLKTGSVIRLVDSKNLPNNGFN